MNVHQIKFALLVNAQVGKYQHAKKQVQGKENICIFAFQQIFLDINEMFLGK